MSRLSRLKNRVRWVIVWAFMFCVFVPVEKSFPLLVLGIIFGWVFDWSIDFVCGKIVIRSRPPA
jgi:hypothetical protein